MQEMQKARAQSLGLKELLTTEHAARTAGRPAEPAPGPGAQARDHSRSQGVAALLHVLMLQPQLSAIAHPKVCRSNEESLKYTHQQSKRTNC